MFVVKGCLHVIVIHLFILIIHGFSFLREKLPTQNTGTSTYIYYADYPRVGRCSSVKKE